MLLALIFLIGFLTVGILAILGKWIAFTIIATVVLVILGTLNKDYR